MCRRDVLLSISKVNLLTGTGVHINSCAVEKEDCKQHKKDLEKAFQWKAKVFFLNKENTKRINLLDSQSPGKKIIVPDTRKRMVLKEDGSSEHVVHVFCKKGFSEILNGLDDSFECL